MNFQELHTRWSGKIEKCQEHIPTCQCCSFASKRHYVVLYPGEFENSKLNKLHLRIIDEGYHGGKKAKCLRHCTAKDLKPMDCKSFPFFPMLSDESKLELLKSQLCPLKDLDLTEHRVKVLDVWGTLIKDKKILEWIKNVKLPGYAYGLSP